MLPSFCFLLPLWLFVSVSVAQDPDEGTVGSSAVGRVRVEVVVSPRVERLTISPGKGDFEPRAYPALTDGRLGMLGNFSGTVKFLSRYSASAQRRIKERSIAVQLVSTAAFKKGEAVNLTIPRLANLAMIAPD